MLDQLDHSELSVGYLIFEAKISSCNLQKSTKLMEQILISTGSLWKKAMAHQFATLYFTFNMRSCTGNQPKGRAVSSIAYGTSESIEWFIRDQAPLRSSDLTHPPPPSPLSPFSKLDRRQTGRLRKRDKFLTGSGAKAGGQGAESCDCKKAWSSINYSILSGVPTVPVPKIEVKISRCSSVARKILVFFRNKAKISVADPWHFGVDPDLNPRIHASD